MLDQRLDARAPPLERFSDLRWRSLLDGGGPLHAIGIDRKCLNGFDVAGAVVALVGAHLLEPVLAKQRSMFVDGRGVGQKEVAMGRFADALDVDVQPSRNMSLLLFLQEGQDVMGLLAQLLHQDAVGGIADIGLLDRGVHVHPGGIGKTEAVGDPQHVIAYRTVSFRGEAVAQLFDLGVVRAAPLRQHRGTAKHLQYGRMLNAPFHAPIGFFQQRL